jgi:NADPH:quinone reductase-like Zn-dependent oxidoreductase
MMRAAVAERPDGPDGLVVRDVPRPEPRPGWALVKVEAFGLNRSEYMTLRGWSGDAVAFPRILGIECVGTVAAVADAATVDVGTTVAAVMGGMGRSFDGGYAEYALLPEGQLMTLETRLPWDVLGALPETFLTASGSLEPLALTADQTLLLRGATSSLGIACLELARAAGVRVVATTRTEGKARRLAERGASAVVIERAGFVERARAELPDAGADGVVDLIGGRAVLDSLALVRRGGTVCNSGMLGGEWVIDDFEPVAMIPSGRKLTSYQSEDAADGSVSGPLLREVVGQVELGAVDPGIDRVYSLEEIKDAHHRMAAGEATGKLVVVTSTPA